MRRDGQSERRASFGSNASTPTPADRNADSVRYRIRRDGVRRCVRRNRTGSERLPHEYLATHTSATLLSPEFLKSRRRPLGIAYVPDVLCPVSLQRPRRRALDWRARTRRHDAACEGALSMTAWLISSPLDPAGEAGGRKRSIALRRKHEGSPAHAQFTAAKTLYAARGRLIPFNSNSPTGSTFTAFSTFISTLGLMRI